MPAKRIIGRSAPARRRPAARPRTTPRYAVGFIGGGNMATALIKGFVAAGVCTPAQICASDIDAAKRAVLQRQLKVHATPDNAAVARDARVVVLAVKPQIIDAVMDEMRPAVTLGTLF